MIAREEIRGESPILDTIQRCAFAYFLHETNRANGLVLDKTCADWPASIAAVGLGLTTYPVGVERGLATRTRIVPLLNSRAERPA